MVIFHLFSLLGADLTNPEFPEVFEAEMQNLLFVLIKLPTVFEVFAAMYLLGRLGLRIPEF